MRNLVNCLITVLFLLQFACERSKQQQSGFDFKPPVVIESRSYKPSPEKLIPPEIIPASGVKKIKAGRPEIVNFRINNGTHSSVSEAAKRLRSTCWQQLRSVAEQAL